MKKFQAKAGPTESDPEKILLKHKLKDHKGLLMDYYPLRKSLRGLVFSFMLPHICAVMQMTFDGFAKSPYAALRCKTPFDKLRASSSY
ncbi:MAG: hypothetical protein WA610_13850, partial [Thermodesulfovibrionales bacterium]